MRSFDAAVTRIVAPALAAQGFTRKRHLWNRRCGLWMDAVELQQSMNNTSLGGRFTVNLAKGPRRRGWRRPIEFPGEGLRIGKLRPDRLDHWWHYDPADPANVEAAVRAALADIEVYGLPYLVRSPLGDVPEWKRLRRMGRWLRRVARPWW